MRVARYVWVLDLLRDCRQPIGTLGYGLLHVHRVVKRLYELLVALPDGIVHLALLTWPG